MNKNTDELVNQLKSCESIIGYLNENDKCFLDYSLSEYIEKLICEKQIKKADIVKQSGLSEIYAYQIISGMKNPSRNKLICIILAINCSVSEANILLNIAGKSELYAKNRRDSIILFAISRSLSFMNTNDLLYELQEELLS